MITWNDALKNKNNILTNKAEVRMKLKTLLLSLAIGFCFFVAHELLVKPLIIQRGFNKIKPELEQALIKGGMSHVFWRYDDIPDSLQIPKHRPYVHVYGHLAANPDHRLVTEELKVRFSPKFIKSLIDKGVTVAQIYGFDVFDKSSNDSILVNGKVATMEINYNSIGPFQELKLNITREATTKEKDW